MTELCYEIRYRKEAPKILLKSEQNSPVFLQQIN